MKIDKPVHNLAFHCELVLTLRTQLFYAFSNAAKASFCAHLVHEHWSVLVEHSLEYLLIQLSLWVPCFHFHCQQCTMVIADFNTFHEKASSSLAIDLEPRAKLAAISCNDKHVIPKSPICFLYHSQLPHQWTVPKLFSHKLYMLRSAKSPECLRPIPDPCFTRQTRLFANSSTNVLVVQ